MNILQYFLSTTIIFIITLSLVVAQSGDLTTDTNSIVTSTDTSAFNKGKTFANPISGNENKTRNDRKKNFKVRNHNKLFKLKKALLETESKNTTISDKTAINLKKSSNESSTETTNSLRNRTKNQLIILQKELRRLTKIAEKLTELNEIYTETKQAPPKKKADGEKIRKNFVQKKGINNRHKLNQSKSHIGDGDSGKKTNEQISKSRGVDDRKIGKWKINKKRLPTTIKPNANSTTTLPGEKGHLVTSRINPKQPKKKSNKKIDINSVSTTSLPKTINTSLPPVTTVIPQ
uniref:Secreted protein n=1 Tax=Strongyloides stercoralis TaxID=6248 RepID=A0A0K0DUK3_STRER